MRILRLCSSVHGNQHMGHKNPLKGDLRLGTKMELDARKIDSIIG